MHDTDDMPRLEEAASRKQEFKTTDGRTTIVFYDMPWEVM